jgi:hypothetical protein
MSDNCAVTFHPTLIEVQSQFANWRNTRQRRERIPEELWSGAVKLCDSYSINKVAKALRLNYTDLSKRVARRQQAADLIVENVAQEFISIDMAQPQASECIIEMEHRNGNKMRMHFKGKVDLDLQSFANSFWS